MNPETKIQNKIERYLKDNRILCWRISDSVSMAGFPDLLVCYQGVFIGLEVKTDKGKPTGQQVKVMSDIENLGQGIARIVRSVEDVERILNEAKDRVKEVPTTDS